MTDRARVGVDVGGTFTDVVVETPDGILVHKVPSTPLDPSEGFERGLREAMALAGVPRPTLIAHGTTVATNAVLERKGARTALIATEGFRDLLQIGRQRRPSLYDLAADRPPPVVERDRSFEVGGRMDPSGEVIEALDEERAADVVGRVVEEGCESVAVCLLFSFANPQHESRLRELLARRAPGVRVSLSSEVLGEFREYERASTTSLDAYVGPVVERYLGRLRDRVGDLQAPVVVMRSGGGTMTSEAAGTQAVHTLLSGPAAGVIGAAAVAGHAGVTDAVTFDMGGTSTDVCLVAGGEAAVAAEATVDGLPFRTPTLGIHTVGAGGGSLLWVDDGGALRAGPVSAGADPGPACYGRGGVEPTVTDAHVVLGHLQPSSFLGGRLALDVEAAREAVSRLAGRLGADVEEVAAAGLMAVRAQMAKAVRVVTVERGWDPRDLSIVAFGGAGPMHACALAEELEMSRVVVPPAAGVASALGLLAAPIVADVSLSRLVVDPVPGDLAEDLGRLEDQAAVEVRDQGEEPATLSRSVDCRYRGQAHEVTIAADPLEGLPDRFHEAHSRRFGWDARNEIVEAVTLRVRAEGARVPPRLPELAESAAREPQARAPVWMAAGTVDAPVYHRSSIGRADPMVGPAVIFDDSSTILVEQRWTFRSTSDGTLLLVAK